MSDLAGDIRERAASVRERIDASARRSGRDGSDVQLIAVTKTHGPEVIRAAVEAGLRHFGENRVEEAGPKIESLGAGLPADVTWHMIGHIQSRKADAVSRYFSCVHSVDRLKVARLLSQGLAERSRQADILLEVNLSGEEAKSGFELSGWPDNRAQIDAFYGEVGQIVALPSLRVRGLMTVAPIAEDPEQVRPVFRRLRELMESLRGRFGGVEWRHLSMGMSGDFEVAIEEGATLVRLGTALFGPRG